ncbi:MAG: tyrosine-type recombinase/integrase [Cyanobacteria bacterium P01_B01_bin.77]
MRKTAPELADARDMRNWLLSQFARETTRRTIQQFGAACKWAVAEDMLGSNPFDGLQRYLVPLRKMRTHTHTAFELEERDAIIAAFNTEDAFYARWVTFMFCTGCRPEEARALKWKHVASDFSQIHICEAWPVDTNIRQGTKNYQATRFPCNESLQLFLRTLHAQTSHEPEDHLFKSVTGKPFDYRRFQLRHWQPLVERLASCGKVAFYLPQYHCRHTFITQLVKSGMELKDISYLCRVSVATLMQFYVSASRTVEVPEF